MAKAKNADMPPRRIKLFLLRVLNGDMDLLVGRERIQFVARSRTAYEPPAVTRGEVKRALQALAKQINDLRESLTTEGTTP